MNKILFLDVDGVLNPHSPSPKHKRFEFTMPGGTFGVYLDPSMGEAVLQLSLDTDSDLVWGTLWGENANEFIGPVVGLPVLPVMEIKSWKFSATTGASKAFTATSYANGRKFAYLDDEPDLGHYLEYFKTTNGRHVYVPEYYGLTSEHLEQAKNHLMN